MTHRIITGTIAFVLTLIGCYTSYKVGRLEREAELLDAHIEFLKSIRPLERIETDEFRKGLMFGVFAWGASINRDLRKSISKLVEEKLKEANDEHTAA